MLSITNTDENPGIMLSKTGKKLNFEFANIAKYYGQNNFFKTNQSYKNKKPPKVKYPKRLLDSKKENLQPFSLFKGRDLGKEAREMNNRAPPVGSYNVKNEYEAKILRIYSRENSKKSCRTTFMNIPKDISIEPEIQKQTESKLTKTHIRKSAANMKKSVFSEYVPDNDVSNLKFSKAKSVVPNTLVKQETINYWDQFKQKNDGLGFVNFDKQLARKYKKKLHFVEFDLNYDKNDKLSTKKKAATDIYFFNKHNLFKQKRKKFTRKLNFYNMKLDLIYPKQALMIPQFNRECGRRPLSQKPVGDNYCFYDFKKKDTYMPNINFSKQIGR